jgi:exodeoxyribonuclease III
VPEGQSRTSFAAPERNAGLRLDHVLLSPVLAARLKDAGVDRDVRGKKDASDHAPVWARLNR